jgi:GNAT superfamily N-acetyltransferase
VTLPDCTDVAPGRIAAVVTCLEMLAPPVKRDDPPACGLALRHVTSPDAQWYRAIYREIGEDWLWFSRLMLSDEALLTIIRDPKVEVYILSHEGREAGLLELDFRVPDICELSFFGVASGLIGSPAGRWLMNRALEIVWSRGIHRFWVHTCTHDHPRALPFYVRSGFRAFKREIEIADDPRLTGVLPRHAAAHVPLIECCPA